MAKMFRGMVESVLWNAAESSKEWFETFCAIVANVVWNSWNSLNSSMELLAIRSIKYKNVTFYIRNARYIDNQWRISLACSSIQPLRCAAASFCILQDFHIILINNNPNSII